MPVEALFIASMLTRKSATAFAAASALSRAFAALAAVSSVRVLSAVSATPSDFIALSAVASRSATLLSPGGRLAISSPILMHALASRRRSSCRPHWPGGSAGRAICVSSAVTRSRVVLDVAYAAHQPGEPERGRDQRGDTCRRRWRRKVWRRRKPACAPRLVAYLRRLSAPGRKSRAAFGSAPSALRGLAQAGRRLIRLRGFHFLRGEIDGRAARAACGADPYAHRRAFRRAFLSLLPALRACRPCEFLLNWPTRREGITQLAHGRQSSARAVLKRSISAASSGRGATQILAAPAAAERRGDLRRQAIMPQGQGLFAQTGLRGAGEVIVGAAGRRNAARRRARRF